MRAVLVSILDLPHGLHLDVPGSVYYERVDGIANVSVLKEVSRSLLHARAWFDAKLEEEESPALAFGKAFHAAILEPEVFAATYVVVPSFGDCRKKENKAMRDAWRAENAGKLELDQDDMRRILGMQKAVHAHPIAGPLVLGAATEATLRWRDEATGIECKARVDALAKSPRVAVDIKTTEDASPRGFERSVASYGYHRQAAFYEEGFRAIGERVEDFVFVAVEKRAPYAVGVYVLDDDAKTRGRRRFREELELLESAYESGRWPGYEEDIGTISLPPWAG